MPLSEIENELRLRARALIEQGFLPSRVSVETWGGYGIGHPCSLCGQVVSSKEVEYEVRQTSTVGQSDYRFHFICHAIWQLECARHEHIMRSGAQPKGRL